MTCPAAPEPSGWTVVTWVEPAAADRDGWTDWIVRCDHCPSMFWNRWTQECFAVQAAHAHRREHERSKS